MIERPDSIRIELRLATCDNDPVRVGKAVHRPSRWRHKVAAAVLGTASIASAIAPSAADAHTPHDPVASVSLSPGFDIDGLGFAVVGGHLMRTDDAFASTRQVVAGIGAGRPAQVAVAPNDANVVYVAGLDGDVFRSSDGGLSFGRFLVEDGTPLGRIVIASDNPDIALTTGLFGGTFRTFDGGASWISVGGLGTVTELFSAASVPSRFFAGNNAGQMFVSTDGGATWLNATAPPIDGVAAIATPIDDQQLVYAVSPTGQLARSTDGGGNYVAVVSEGLTAAPVRDAVVMRAPFGGVEVWVTNDDGVFVSSNDGATFLQLDDGLSIDPEAESQNAASFSSIVGHTDATGQNTLIVGGFDGLAQFDPATQTWTETETFTELITGFAVSPDFANDQTIAVTTYVKGAYLSTDGGATFSAMSSGLDQETGRSNTVLEVNRLQGVAFSPSFADDGIIVLSTADRIAISNNRGRTWTRILVAPPATEGPKIRHFAIGMGETILGPALVLGARQGVVYRSDRGGRAGTWNATDDLLDGVRSIALSPQYIDVPELFAATTQRLYRSFDGAASFEALDVELRSGIVALSPNFGSDRTVFAGDANGLVVSRDAGDTWTNVGVVFGPNDIQAIAVSPNFTDDSTVLVSLAGLGLHRSTDGGASFTPIAPELVQQNLVFSNTTPIPTSNPLVYADANTVVGTANGSVLVSRDGGDTWDITTLPPAAEYVPPVDNAPQATDETATSDTASATVAEPSPAQVTPLPVGDQPARDRRIWLVALGVIATALALIFVTARRR